MNEEQKKAFDRSGEQPDKIAAQPGQTETAEAYFEKEQEVVSIYYEAPPEDCEVIGVRFRSSNKIYFFDPDGVRYPENCHAVVETARGQEFGTVAQSNHIVPGKEIVLPLRKALRVATPEDERHQEENGRKAEEAFLIGNKKIAEHGLDMKLIDAEYTFDNTKLLFYFTSDNRVDFRDLVKDLASVFHCRIELRQMGIRDEAKVLGGLGICGRPFCCHAFLPDFVQVSIKMAKEQNLSLNSVKISGACGRLMCCLRYEYDTYVEEGRKTPKVDSLVNTPDGIGVVVEAKPLVGLVKVRPLNDAGGAPKVYSREVLTPIKKGDENYEKAAEEKALEKQARAAGTTRAALKAAKANPEKEGAKEEKPQRPARPAPQRAASYTGQVLPAALERSVKSEKKPLAEHPAKALEESKEKEAGISPEIKGKPAKNNEENRNRRNQPRKKNNAGLRPSKKAPEASGNTGTSEPKKHPQTGEKPVAAGANAGETRPLRYEKTSRKEGFSGSSAPSGKTVQPKRENKERPEQPSQTNSGTEEKPKESASKRNHRPFRYNHKKNSGGQ